MKQAQTLLIAKVTLDGVEVLETINDCTNEQAQIVQVIDMVYNYISEYQSLVIIHAGKSTVLNIFHGYSTSVEMQTANELHIRKYMESFIYF